MTKNLNHKTKIETLYARIKFPKAIDLWAAHYAKNELDVLISNARHLDPVRQAIENEVWGRIVPIGGQILDIACGRGFFCRRLQNTLDFDIKITGTDISEKILHIALSENKGISFVLSNAEILPYRDEFFDVVFCISAIEQIETPTLVLDEIWRILKPDGYLYLCLHKPFIDPFLITWLGKNFVKFCKKFLNLVVQYEIKVDENHFDHHIGYKGPLRDLRQNLRAWLSESGFILTESRALLHQMDWKIYERFSSATIPILILVGQWLNRFPFCYYKDLEYWLLQKAKKV
jgi:ubiquinone/menaquinone biosynthesis C-methylase UbiE